MRDEQGVTTAVNAIADTDVEFNIILDPETQQKILVMQADEELKKDF